MAPDKAPALITVMKENKVLLKIFAGTNGSRLKQFVENYNPDKRYTLTNVYNMAEKTGLGSKEDLIVMSHRDHLHKMSRTLPSTYRDTFNKPRFHPVAKEGKVDQVYVIKLES